MQDPTTPRHVQALRPDLGPRVVEELERELASAREALRAHHASPEGLGLDLANARRALERRDHELAEAHSSETALRDSATRSAGRAVLDTATVLPPFARRLGRFTSPLYARLARIPAATTHVVTVHWKGGPPQ